MPFSLHTHSGQFCAHAKGTLEEVVQEAIKKKFLVLGLSEHCPRYRIQDLYPEESHLTPADLAKNYAEFVTEARRLQQKYSSQISLIIGQECETIQPDLSPLQTLDLVQQHHLDYVVGSVHHVYEIPIDFDMMTFRKALQKAEELNPVAIANNVTREELLFSDYFDAQFKTLQQVKPMVVGHFDLICLFRPDWVFTPKVWEKITRNVEYVVEYGGLFEINASGWRKGLKDAYPQRDVLQLIISKNGKFTISDDSHGPHAVGLNYDKLYAYLEEFQINTLYYLDYTDEKKNKVEVKVLERALEHPFWEQFVTKAREIGHELS